ncbi:hypothetical protein [Nocardia sp. NPDC051981]|uniref:hypothetical protein n=1 Tax=Nocardia sp. NPDC051981 TaxID=3155417 RepID=UPI003439A5E5
MTTAGRGDASFTGSIPEIYDDLLVPMIFADEGSSHSTPETGAVAFCQGTPLRGEIERHSFLDVESATAIATTELRRRYGPGEFGAPIRWLQVTARRPAD